MDTCGEMFIWCEYAISGAENESATDWKGVVITGKVNRYDLRWIKSVYKTVYLSSSDVALNFYLFGNALHMEGFDLSSTSKGKNILLKRFPYERTFAFIKLRVITI